VRCYAARSRNPHGGPCCRAAHTSAIRAARVLARQAVGAGGGPGAEPQQQAVVKELLRLLSRRVAGTLVPDAVTRGFIQASLSHTACRRLPASPTSPAAPQRVPPDATALLVQTYAGLRAPEERVVFLTSLTTELGLSASELSAALRAWQAALSKPAADAAAATGEPRTGAGSPTDEAAPDALRPPYVEPVYRAADRVASAARPLYTQLFLPISQVPGGAAAEGPRVPLPRRSPRVFLGPCTAASTGHHPPASSTSRHPHALPLHTRATQRRRAGPLHRVSCRLRPQASSSWWTCGPTCCSWPSSAASRPARRRRCEAWPSTSGGHPGTQPRPCVPLSRLRNSGRDAAPLPRVLLHNPHSAPLPRCARGLIHRCRQSLAEWFSVGLLHLELLSWQRSPAALLVSFCGSATTCPAASQLKQTRRRTTQPPRHA
jgi:hypothetical protein